MSTSPAISTDPLREFLAEETLNMPTKLRPKRVDEADELDIPFLSELALAAAVKANRISTRTSFSRPFRSRARLASRVCRHGRVWARQNVRQATIRTRELSTHAWTVVCESLAQGFIVAAAFIAALLAAGFSIALATSRKAYASGVIVEARLRAMSEQLSRWSIEPTTMTARVLVSFVCGIAIGGSTAWFVDAQSRDVAPAAARQPEPVASAPQMSSTPPAKVQRERAPAPLVETVGTDVAPAVARQPELRKIREPQIRQAAQDASTVSGSARPRFVGSLAVSSAPQGARVTMNGRSVGVTPLLLSEVPAGSRVLQVRLDGYQMWSSGVRVVANEQTNIRATLARSVH